MFKLLSRAGVCSKSGLRIVIGRYGYKSSFGANKDENNAFAKHLAIYHPEHEGNRNAFEFKLVEVHNKPLTRLCSESNHIHRSTAQIPMNSKAEWHQPVVARVVVTRELEELEQGGRAGQRGRGRGGGRQQAGGRRQRGGA